MNTFLAGAVSLGLCLLSPGGWAEPLPMPDQVSSHISGQAFEHSLGRLAVNQSAGAGNRQANLAAIALTSGPTAGQAGVQLRWLAPPDEGLSLARSSNALVAVARIEGQAFAASQGLVALNQVSGNDNRQLNALLLATGLGSDGAVAIDLTAPMELADRGNIPASRGEVAIAATAFHDSRGIVQINQVAGNQNLAANTLVIRFSGE